MRSSITLRKETVRAIATLHVRPRMAKRHLRAGLTRDMLGGGGALNAPLFPPDYNFTLTLLNLTYFG